MKAGFGSAVISPTPPVYLAGFGARTQPAESVHEDLEARALYLDDGSTALCLVVCDLLGMSPDNAAAVRSPVAAKLEVPHSHVVVACTHTHSGPSLIAGSEALGWPTPDGYLELVRDGCISAANGARDRADETTLRYARAPLPDGFAFNRRGGDFEEPWFSVLHAPGVGILANFGIHPVLLGPQWLAVATDWVGPFRRALEALVDGVAIELTGALGDINPTPPAGEPGDSYEPWADAEQTADYGKHLAHLAAESLDHAGPVTGPLGVLRDDTIEVPVGGTGLAAMYGQPAMHVELIEWSIGDVSLVSIPGEAFHALGREVSSARDNRVLLAGLSPWQGYLPHPYGDGYEEGVSYGPGAVAAIREALLATP